MPYSAVENPRIPGARNYGDQALTIPMDEFVMGPGGKCHLNSRG